MVCYHANTYEEANKCPECCGRVITSTPGSEDYTTAKKSAVDDESKNASVRSSMEFYTCYG